mmetsp:Transcript_16681/g.31735  ORF Transcript_16681/g.31735 Transcript_16681/m.31735 type:complete len:111 (+) Transcript_16681:526-858(+)
MRNTAKATATALPTHHTQRGQCTTAPTQAKRKGMADQAISDQKSGSKSEHATVVTNTHKLKHTAHKVAWSPWGNQLRPRVVVVLMSKETMSTVMKEGREEGIKMKEERMM